MNLNLLWSPSPPPLTMRSPIEQSESTSAVWPARLATSSQTSVSHTRTMLSSLPDMSHSVGSPPPPPLPTFIVAAAVVAPPLALMPVIVVGAAMVVLVAGDTSLSALETRGPSPS